MREVSRFKIIVPSLIDRRATSLSERQLARENISDPGANMVMHSKVRSWGKRKFGGAHSELAIELGQVAEGDLVEFDFRRDTSCFHLFLSRRAIFSAKQRHEEQ